MIQWPGVAAIACSDCQKFNYSIPDGKLETYEVDDDKRLPVLRDEDMPPPCDLCPRGGPENEKRLELSDRNYTAYSLYHKLKACRGTYQLHPKIANCATFAENMWIVERTIESAKASRRLRAYEEAAKKRE